MPYDYLDYGYIEERMLPRGIRCARMSLTPERPPLFRPGRVTITDAARQAAGALDMTPEDLLAMHVRGLWGNGVRPDEEEENEAVLRAGRGRVLSVYVLEDDLPGGNFYAYTDVSDKGRGNATVVCLLEEYGW